MKKLLATLFLTSMMNFSYASYLDDWSNDDLCGWMESNSTPEYILEEVAKREILCHGGVEVMTLPSLDLNNGGYGTVFDSPDPSLIPEPKPDSDSDSNSDYSY